MNDNPNSPTETRRTNYLRNDLALERRARCLSIEQAARIIGVSRKTLESYERGRYMPSLSIALRLQILYRGQLASFYQSLYANMTAEIRAAEVQTGDPRGDQ